MVQARKKINKKNNKDKEILLLTFLLVITVSVNFFFILLLETRSNASVSERILKALTGNNLLDIFNKDVLVGTPEISQGETTAVTPSPETISPSPEPIPVPETINPTTMTKTVQVDFSQPKTVYYEGKTPITIDYQKGVMISEGREIPIIVDGGTWDDVKKSIQGVQAWHPLTYPNFNVFIDESYYSNNPNDLNNFFNNLSMRFDVLKFQTGWSSEKFNSTMLSIYVTEDPACFGSPSAAWLGGAFLSLSSPLYKQVPFNCTAEGGTGELGIGWPYMGHAIHEVTHSINPLPIYSRPWLTEGFSRYYQFNILSSYGDINQNTTNQAIFQGTGYYNWQSYISNFYLDGYNYPIQSSAGYDISAWMFSMMRDNHSLNWNNFYSILNNNLETLDKSKVLGNYYTDTFVIDVFGKASSLNFPATQTIWRYDGASGPGWGVRNWTDRNWYADLFPSSVTFSKTNPYTGESINLIATVYNNGQTNTNNVSVRFYNGVNLVNEQFVNVNALGNTVVSTPFTSASAGTFTINVKVDEPNIKIETNDSNNNNSGIISFLQRPAAPSCWYDKKSRTMKCA